MNLTEDDFKKLKQEIIDDLEEDYFAMRRPGFNIESNCITQGHGVAELSITTDEDQGIQFYKKGNAKVLANKSIELVAGEDNKDNKVIAITLDARTGDILISAPDGDLILEGANVKIIATDADGDVFINSKKTISVDSPEVGVTGTKVNLNAISDMNVSGGQTNIYTETGSAMFTSGQDPILSPSLLQSIINFADQAKARLRGFS
tara:strand:- start:2259 stop:2873 length:615 start_codon:yes stop_codon:yes gene_type:complete